MTRKMIIKNKENKANFSFPFRVSGCLLFLLMSISLNSQTISPYLIGNNAWYDGNVGNLWGLMSTAGFQTIRIGGASAEGYSATSTKYLTLVNGIKSAGAEPVVQIARYYTDAEVKAIITNINITNAKKVKFWSIGNEPDHTNRPSTPEEVCAYIKRISSALKSVDPTIKVLGPETAGFQSTNYVSRMLGGDQDITGTDANGNYYIDIYTWHRYMFIDIAGMESDVNTFLSKVAQINQKRPVDKQLSWGITEFNTTYNNSSNTLGDDQNVWSFRAGQVFAEVYALGMRKGATVMTAWSMLEGEVEREGTDLSLFDKDLKGRSNYYHSLMLGQNMKSNYLLATDNQTSVSVISMKDDSGVAVMILNKDKVNGFDYSLRLNTSSIVQSSSLNINVPAGLNQEIQGYIPAAATQMLVFDAAGTLTKRYVYTSLDADARRGPVIQTVLCNTPPAINLISKQIIPNDKGVVTVNLSGITDGDKCTQGVTVTAQSANTNIVSVSQVNYNACSKTAILELLPKASGKTSVTVTVTENNHSCTPLSTSTGFEVQAYTPSSIPGKIEAENYINMYGVQNQSTTDSGGGSNVGYIDAGDWMDYGVRVDKTSVYDVNFRLASFPTSTVGAFKLMNGNSTLATVTVQKTTGWQDWMTQTARVSLTAGDQILRIAVTGSGLNINWMDFTDTKTAVSNTLNDKNEVDISRQGDQIVFDFSKLTPSVSDSVLRIFTLSGQLLVSQTLPGDSKSYVINKSELNSGVLIANYRTKNNIFNQKFVLN